MISDSARSTSAAQSRFRVAAPNATPREILVVALDEKSAELGAMLADQSWRSAEFVNFRMPGMAADGQAWLAALNRHGFDLMVMVGTAGEDLGKAGTIGGKGIAGGMKVSSVLLTRENATPEIISAGLLELRPWSRTLAVIGSADYLTGALHALGA